MAAIGAFAAEDIGSVRPVSLDIDRVGIGLLGRLGPAVTDEVDAADDLCGREQIDGWRGGRIGGGTLVGRHGAGTAKIEVGVVDAGVQHRDADAGAIDPRVLQLGRPDVRIGRVVAELVLADRADREHFGALCNRTQLRGIDADDHGVVSDAHARNFYAAERHDLLQQRVLMRLDIPRECYLLRAAELAADVLGVLAVGEHQRGARELYDHVDLTGGGVE